MDHQAFAQLLGNYGEFVGAIAVVVTLFYLANQIRSSARMAAIEARQTVLDRFSTARASLAGNAHGVAALRKAYQGSTLETMSQEEQDALNLAVVPFADNLYNAIRLKDEAVLDEEAFEYIARAFCSFCATDAGRAQWAIWNSTVAFPDRLNRFLESRLKQ